MCYIFEKHGIQGYQIWYSCVSNTLQIDEASSRSIERHFCFHWILKIASINNVNIANNNVNIENTVSIANNAYSVFWDILSKGM